MGAENGQVGVLALALFKGMAVDHGEPVVVVLLRDEAARILAEGADLVLERRRVADELGLVEDLVTVSMTSLRTSTRTPMSTVPG